uniref:Estradiol 17-beta-dehydrogenase 12-like n=1 Tax=Phallusia mammillata TaxID=59560 RepID=A0A6F9DE45_9ASCI|nr:estradiol 17-beta-dehydrogenase 12-like [Phallusia mammillata]
MPDPSQAIRNTVEVNIISVLKMTQLILPEMVKKQRGLIINVSSGGCVAPLPSLAVYGATKSFVDYFSRCISHEYEVEGIKAVCIMPYFVSSNLTLNAKPNFWLRSAKDYVRNVLAVTTTSTRWSHGCWQHDVHGWMGRNLPHKVYATSIGLVLQRIKNKQM